MKESANQKISEALGIEPIDHSDEDILLPVPAEAKTKLEILRDKPLEEIIIDEDFNEARDNLKNLIQKQADAIDQLSTIAEEGESARHYEVLAAMMKNAMEMNDRLMGINKQRKELTKGLPIQKQTSLPSGDANIKVDNAIFVGTSADLDKILQDRKNQKISIEPPKE